MTMIKEDDVQNPKQRPKLHSLRSHSSPRAVAGSSDPSDRPAVAVPISIDGKEHAFSAILLRDLCHCPACVHPSTKQRLYSTADIPKDIQARPLDAQTVPDKISLKWVNDTPGFDETHETVLNVDDLRALKDAGALPGPF